MRFDLNPDLIEVPVADKQRSAFQDKEATLKKLCYRGRDKEPQRMLEDFLPADGIYCTSFMSLLGEAWNRHLPVSFGPHDLWYLMMHQIALRVNKDPEEFRHLFTSSDKKIELSFTVESGIAALLPSMVEAVNERMPSQNIGLFLPDFSTHTPASTAATMAASMSMVEKFYGWSAVMICGIPRIEVRGTVEDWERFVTHAENLGALFGEISTVAADQRKYRKDSPTMKDWFQKIAERGRDILKALQGGSYDFLHDIFHIKLGNGPCGGKQNYTQGWLKKEFMLNSYYRPELDLNFWSRVPMNLVIGGVSQSIEQVHGAFTCKVVDGFYTPEYGACVLTV